MSTRFIVAAAAAAAYAYVSVGDVQGSAAVFSLVAPLGPGAIDGEPLPSGKGVIAPSLDAERA